MNSQNEILITVPDIEDVIAFSKWFKNEGFNAFMKSEYNQNITCLASDEFPDESIYEDESPMELSPIAQFELE